MSMIILCSSNVFLKAQQFLIATSIYLNSQASRAIIKLTALSVSTLLKISRMNLFRFFFKACAEIVYIYFNDNNVNVNNFKSNLVSCCIETSCQAFSRQLIKKRNFMNIQIRNDESRTGNTHGFSSLTLSLTHKLDHHYHLFWSRVHRKIH